MEFSTGPSNHMICKTGKGRTCDFMLQNLYLIWVEPENLSLIYSEWKLERSWILFSEWNRGRGFWQAPLQTQSGRDSFQCSETGGAGGGRGGTHGTSVFKLIQCKAKFWIVYELFTESSILMHTAHSLFSKFMCCKTRFVECDRFYSK